MGRRSIRICICAPLRSRSRSVCCRSVSRRRFKPYFGGGLAVINWKYRESGEFIDFNAGREIFVDTFEATGNSTGAIVLGGVRFAGRRVPPRAASSDISMPLAICRTTSAHPRSTSAAGPTTSQSARDSEFGTRESGSGARDPIAVGASSRRQLYCLSPGSRVPDPGSRATVRAFIAWIYSFALSLGGPGLFTVAFLDSSFISLPQINDILVVLMVTNNKALMPYYAFMATAGSVAGCYVIYYLAKKGGEAFVRKRLKPGHVERSLALYKRHGLLALMYLRSCRRPLRSNCSCWPQVWRRCDRCNSCWRLPSRGRTVSRARHPGDLLRRPRTRVDAHARPYRGARPRRPDRGRCRSAVASNPNTEEPSIESRIPNPESRLL